MTTFDFSIYKAPPGRNWRTRFQNEPDEDAQLECVVGNLGTYGIDGWEGFGAFHSWVQNEGIKSYTPDWCLHVAKCSRPQLLRFADTCLERKISSAANHAAFVHAIDPLLGKLFVIQILEF